MARDPKEVQMEALRKISEGANLIWPAIALLLVVIVLFSSIRVVSYRGLQDEAMGACFCLGPIGNIDCHSN